MPSMLNERLAASITSSQSHRSLAGYPESLCWSAARLRLLAQYPRPAPADGVAPRRASTWEHSDPRLTLELIVISLCVFPALPDQYGTCDTLLRRRQCSMGMAWCKEKHSAFSAVSGTGDLHISPSAVLNSLGTLPYHTTRTFTVALYFGAGLECCNAL